MHRGFAAVIHAVDIDAQIEQHLCGFKDFSLGPGGGRLHCLADPSCHHQGSTVFRVVDQWIGSQFEQHAHERSVRGLGSQEERRCPFPVKLAPFEPGVHPGAMVHQLFGELCAAHDS